MITRKAGSAVAHRSSGGPPFPFPKMRQSSSGGPPFRFPKMRHAWEGNLIALGGRGNTYPPSRLFFFQIHRFEVTWLGLHAFREVFGAFARKDRGFARCKLDVEKALMETAGSRGGGFDGIYRKKSKGKEVAAAAGGEEGATSNTPHGVRRGRAYDRLRRVVRSPDALSLMQTLTS